MLGRKGGLVKLRDRDLGYRDLGSQVSRIFDTSRAGGRGLRGIAPVVQAEHFQKSLQVFAIALVGLCLGVASAERSLSARYTVNTFYCCLIIHCVICISCTAQAQVLRI